MCASVQMDVQGAEQLLMYGAQETIKREKPVVAYENVSVHGYGCVVQCSVFSSSAAIMPVQVPPFFAYHGLG